MPTMSFSMAILRTSLSEAREAAGCITQDEMREALNTVGTNKTPRLWYSLRSVLEALTHTSALAGDYLYQLDRVENRFNNSSPEVLLSYFARTNLVKTDLEIFAL